MIRLGPNNPHTYSYLMRPHLLYNTDTNAPAGLPVHLFLRLHIFITPAEWKQDRYQSDTYAISLIR
jgi:hypothetical protein